MAALIRTERTRLICSLHRFRLKNLHQKYILRYLAFAGFLF